MGAKINLDKLKLVALDSNIFIYYFDQNPEFGQSAKAIFDKLSSDQLRAITSEITTTELLSHPKLSEKEVREMDRQFLDIPNLEVLNIDHNLVLEAAKIRRKYGFRLADSIQLATAKLSRAKAFISNDQNLKKFKELKIILISEI